ncbi:PREDICTED: protocadherin alpha-5-like [Propithecus coquereli]|uniref:protocadherin alpha-5-like n=1 Tax=Propithecus coquereli TaxID=379532 RepID=UPI00063F8176|nr:PREDICTED: protocadherin alpha-5-like [Propithecus coquereli]
MVYSQRGSPQSRRLLLWLLLAAWEAGSGQLHYSVPEEAKHGTFVGRITQDLGLELAELVPRLFRVASKDRGDLLEVNLQNGILFVNSRIDREELCGRSAECSIHLEVIVDRPLQVFHVEVEVKDINDNPPRFSREEQKLFILESRMPDSRFPVEGASDLDIGANAELRYKLNPNEYFDLDVKTNEEKTKFLELVLKKSLDREETEEHRLLLIAIDGGKPELTGTVQLLINVLDANDNAPEFDKSIYNVRLFENTRSGTLVIKLNASDADEGINKEIVYFFSNLVSDDVKSKFIIDSNSGEVKVKGELDYEDCNLYEINIDAVDRSTFPLTGHCKVIVKLLDVNDNIPEMAITSLFLPVKEDAPTSTVVALISVSDLDSGANGQVTCSLTAHVPFKLVSTFRNYYSLVLDGALDRESISDYELVVTARDGGSPSLWATASVSVEVADVNDNAPAFPQPEYTVFVKENNPPGCHIFTVSARDADAQENARVSYSLVERRVGERALSSYVSVHAESGKVYALQPLDHEELELLQFQVSARDAGVPPLGSNVTLQVFVLDENDNPPVLLAPRGGSGVGLVNELVPRSVGAGHVVAKVRAVDADSGYNAWLSYELQPAVGSARSPFRVGLYTGEISTTRALDEADAPRQRLLVLVRDHGEPALTATATVLVSLVESGQAPKASSRALAGAANQEMALVDVNVYLIVAICAVSSLLVLTMLLYTALRCSAPPTEDVCGPGQPRLVCSSAAGSCSYSKQKQQRVCSGDGQPKTDLMAFSPSLPQGPTSTDTVSLKSLIIHQFLILFDLDVKTNEEKTKFLELVLKKSLDREETEEHRLLLIAIDGGKPELTGTVQLLINVLDANDNAPEFDKSIYNVRLFENTRSGTLVIKLNASDADEGINKEIVYFFSNLVSDDVKSKFIIDSNSGEVKVKGELDYEDCNLYEINIDAVDRSTFPLTGHCKVIVKLLDVNDNIPEMAITSLFLPVKEDAPTSTVVALISVSDLDSGANGQVTCSLTAHVPFKLVSTFRNYYSLVLDGALDRESISDYELVVTARDGGSPSLWATASVSVEVADVKIEVFKNSSSKKGCIEKEEE